MRRSTKMMLKGRMDRIRGRTMRMVGNITGDAVRKVRGRARQSLGSARVRAGKGAATARMRMRPMRHRLKTIRT